MPEGSLRILYVSSRGDAFGGASLHVKDMAQALRQDGHVVRILVGGTRDMVVPRRFMEQDLDFVCIPEMGRRIDPVRDFRAWRSLRREIRRFQPDLVSAHTSKGGALTRLACLGLGCPVIYTPHCWSFVEGFPHASLYRTLESLLAPLAARIVAVSEDEREYGLSRGVGRPARTVCIHNGVHDNAPFSSASGDSSGTGCARIVMVGRFEAQKDQGLLVRALAGLRHRDWHLTLVGDGPLQGDCEALVEELGLGNRVTFAGYASQVAGHLAAADLFVLASRWEGFPRSTLEAMRAGLPVIVSDVGGSREAVREGQTGFVVPKGDCPRLQEALERLLADPELRRAMGRAGRLLFEERFTFERMYGDYIQLYRALTGRAQPPGAAPSGSAEDPTMPVANAAPIAGPFAAVLRAFDDAGLGVLLWKGPDRLERALSGEGDLDLLAAEGHFEAAGGILRKNGFVPLSSQPWKAQVHVQDWLGADRHSGRLLHVQLYQRLVLGTPLGFQALVPGSAALFERTAGRCPTTSSLADAAILRICRSALASPLWPGRSGRALLREAQELARPIPAEALSRCAAELFDPGIVEPLLTALAGGSRRALRRHLLTRYQAARPRMGAVCIAALARLNRRTTRFAVFPQRMLGSPAPVVAVIGSDGSGKSTISRRVTAEASRKLDVHWVYFGTGDGPGSLIRQALSVLKRRIQRSLQPAPAGAASPLPRDVPALAKACWGVAVARERLAKMRRARRASRAGFLVVTDRYPQAELSGIHDGPRLGEWLKAEGWRAGLARWEQRVYQRIAAVPPDLVLLLDVTPEVAEGRRPEESSAELRRRIEAAKALRFGGAPRVVLDASAPLEQVAGLALGTVLERLPPTRNAGSLNMEFVGLPGVGKSYLSARLRASHAGLGAQDRLNGRPALLAQTAKAVNACRFALRHPATTAHIRQLVRQSAQHSLRDVSCKTVNLLAELNLAEGAGSREPREQGVLQAIWSIGLRARDASRVLDLTEILRAWLPRVAIYVQADREVHIRWLLSRESGQSRLDGLAPDRLAAEFDRGTQLLDDILSRWQQVVPGAFLVKVWNQPEPGDRKALEVLTGVLP